MEKLTVKYIGIKNILGIECLEYQPGKINAIDGANATGKTSFLEAIKAVVGGGHDGTLLRNGKDEGEIVLIFDNGMKLTKKVGKEKSSISIQDGDGLPVKRAASFLKEIIDVVGLNPIQLLTASQKDRVDILLSSVNLTFPEKALKKAGIAFTLDDAAPVQALDNIKKKVFESRSQYNKAIKEKEIMVDQMADTLPFGDKAPDYKKQLEDLEKKKANAQIDFDDELNKEKIIKETMLEENYKRMNELIAGARKDFDARVEELQDQTRDKDEKDRKTYEVVCAKIRLETHPIIELMAKEIAVVLEKDANSEKVRIGREYVKEGQETIKTLQKEADGRTKQLKDLAKIKKELLEALPIKGLEIIDGDICLDGVLFDHVNEGKRIQFILDVAGIRDSELPLVCVDGLEALDQEHFKLFCKTAEKTEMQFFVTRVTGDESMQIRKISGKDQ